MTANTQAENTPLNVAPRKATFDGSVALLLAGSLYLLISLAFNAFLQIWYFLVPAVIAGLLGLAAAIMLLRGNANASAIAMGLISVIIGFAITFITFWIGLDIQGVVGPAWIIYALAGYWLYRNKRQLTP